MILPMEAWYIHVFINQVCLTPLKTKPGTVRLVHLLVSRSSIFPETFHWTQKTFQCEDSDVLASSGVSLLFSLMLCSCRRHHFFHSSLWLLLMLQSWGDGSVGTGTWSLCRKVQFPAPTLGSLHPSVSPARGEPGGLFWPHMHVCVHTH